MAEMRRREVLAKKLAIDEFKASEEYKEVTLARALTNARSRLIFFSLTSTSMIYRSIPITLMEMKTKRKREKMQFFLNSLSHLRVSMYIFLFRVMATLVLE